MRGALTLVLLALVYLIVKADVGGGATLFGLLIVCVVMLPLLALGKRAPKGDAKADQKKRDRRFQKDIDDRIQFEISNTPEPRPAIVDGGAGSARDLPRQALSERDARRVRTRVQLSLRFLLDHRISWRGAKPSATG